MRSDPPPDPMAKLDTLRCDTRALDAGALRAIQAAYASGVAQASGNEAALAALAPVPANDGVFKAPADTTHDAAHDTARDAAADAAHDTARDVAADTVVEPSSERRDDPIEERWAKERPTERLDPAALPSSHGAPFARPGAADASTLEVDYSPADRRDRARAATVRRTARFVVFACAGLAAILGVWVTLRSSNDRPARAPELPASASAAHAVPLAASTEPREPAPPSLPEPSSAFSAPAPSTIPTVPVVLIPDPSGAAPTATPVPGTTRPVAARPAASRSPGPEPGPSAAPLLPPSGTVPPPPGGIVALPNPD